MQRAPGVGSTFCLEVPMRHATVPPGLDGQALAEQTDLIVKPFSVDGLLGKVRGLLDAV